uniref:Uncharacterized protein n=1 Tax=Physcomitrium patens TaxID=3218 RepID=A0A7I4F4R5_PHYPA
MVLLDVDRACVRINDVSAMMSVCRVRCTRDGLSCNLSVGEECHRVDMERQMSSDNAGTTHSLQVYNVPPIIIDAMLLEDVDKYTWINSRDITVLLDPLQGKQRLRVELGPVERIKPAIEAEKRIRIAWLQSSNSISNEMGASGYYEDERILRRCGPTTTSEIFKRIPKPKQLDLWKFYCSVAEGNDKVLAHVDDASGTLLFK